MRCSAEPGLEAMTLRGNPAGPRLGIDLGGTKIEGIVLGPTGERIASLRVASPRASYNGTISALADMTAGLEQASGGHALPVGAGIPGSISKRTGLVHNSNATWLNGQNLVRDLAAALSPRQVAIANDANCFALSEATDGAGRNAKSVFGVILGTGVGGGLVINGAIVDGPLGIAGEWGHNPLPWARVEDLPGHPCWCGRSGCMESWVSGPALAADYARTTDKTADTQEIAARAQSGDPEALAALARHADRLARGLSHVVNIIDPDVIVLGGGLSGLTHLYGELPCLMRPHIFADGPIVDIRPPKWGDASGVRGAAWLTDPLSPRAALARGEGRGEGRQTK